MHSEITAIREAFAEFNSLPVDALEKLPQAGSERRYYRLQAAGKSYIVTAGDNVPENEAFIYFSNHFSDKNLSTPRIFFIAGDKKIYFQEDFGDVSLLDKLEEAGFTPEIYSLYKQSLQQLAALQVQGHAGLDYSRCLTNASFGKEAIMADLLYFKYYFLDALRRPYDKQKLIADFESLSIYLSKSDHQYFMFRDFQARNIMVTADNQVHFIDYQGGMQGAPQYDVASLLWQARANLPADWKASLLDAYTDAFEKQIAARLDKQAFRQQYTGYVLIRMLQVLGAYGFRGLFERKAHFLTSIPLALQNLRGFIEEQNPFSHLTEFCRILEVCVSDEIISTFTHVKANKQTPLLVHINSFSFIKDGYPPDETSTGGGYVFDCRGLLNPGRIEEFKRQTGRDKPVKDYLEQNTRMPEFLNNVYNLVDISVEDYIARDFQHLTISFGCTGGQHRSVYAADAVARHLRNKYGVKTELRHLQQHIHEIKESPND